MNTHIIEKRQANFRTSKFFLNQDKLDNLKSREHFRLSLRKEKLNQYFMDKRLFMIQDSDVKLEIDPSSLSVPSYIIDSLSMISSPENQKSTLLNCLKAEQEDLVKYALYHLRKRLEMENTFNHELLDEEIIKALVYFVDTSDDESIIYEGLWSLINISYTNYDFCTKVFNSSYMINVLEKKMENFLSNNSNEQILSCVIWLLGHITLDYKEIALYLINNLTIINCLNRIVVQQHNNAEVIMKNILWFVNFSFLMKSELSKNFTDSFKDKIFNILILLSKNSYLDLRIDALNGLSVLVKNSNCNVVRERIIDERIVDQILSTNYDKAIKLLYPSIKLLGYLLSGKDCIISRLIENNVISFLKVHINNKNHIIRKDVCWAFSNISCVKMFLGNLVREGVFEQLIYLAKNDMNPLVRKEALWSIANGCYFADVPMINLVVKLGIIEIIKNYLEYIELDWDIVEILSEALKKIFEIGCVISKEGENKYITEFIRLGGQDTIEKILLKSNVNEKILELLSYINEKFMKSYECNENRI